MNATELRTSTNEIVADLQSKEGCEVVSANPENGHIRARMPYSDICVLPELTGIGGDRFTKDEKKHLNNAIRRTSGTPIYGIAVGAFKQNETFRYPIVDGSNRRNEIQFDDLAGQVVDVIIYAAWDNVEAAQEGRVLLNTSGKNFDEIQVMSMLDAGFSASRVSDVSRVPNTTVQRYETIRDFTNLRNLVTAKVITVSRAADLAKACGDNEELKERLENFITSELETAEDKAAKYKKKIQKDTEHTVTDEDKEKMKAEYYMKKVKWDAAKSAIGEPKCHVTKDNKPSLDLKDVKLSVKSVEVGSEDDWMTKPNIQGFNKKFEDWSLNDYEDILSNWDWMKSMIEAHYNRCKLLAGSSDIKFPLKSDFAQEAATEPETKE